MPTQMSKPSNRLIQDFSIPAVFAGFITFLIGISVSSVLVIQAAQLLGANTEEFLCRYHVIKLQCLLYR